VANQAVSLAEGVRDGFAGFHLGAGDYVVDLSIPEGPSTGGGAQARQKLRLVPRRPGYAIVVCGAVDPVSSMAELRTFEHVAVLHELRFRRPLEISGEEYASFLAKAELVFQLARLKSTRVPPSAELLAEQRARRRLSVPMLVIFVCVTILAALVAYRVGMTLRH
jgi:translation initiation factor IF-2